MKKTISNYTRLVLCLCVAILALSCLTGCQAGAGETRAEVNRRHGRVFNTGMLRIQDDVDSLFLLDRPTRLSDKYVR
ncbi:MAG: hypothetical protein KAS23_02725 [Anaerohalosphaera sp.]|nr:hypothetical protein [Anaerohalosphaera sp.]